MRSGTVTTAPKTALRERFGTGFRRVAGAATALAILAMAAPAVAQNYRPPIYAAQVYVRVAPPPLRREVIPVRPGHRYVWRGGHWWWHRGRWVWARGAWVIGPHVGARWVPGHWAHHHHGWAWRPGHWR